MRRLTTLLIGVVLALMPLQSNSSASAEEVLSPVKESLPVTIASVPYPLDTSIVLLQARIAYAAPTEPRGAIHFYIDGQPLLGCETVALAYILSYFQASCQVPQASIAGKTVTVVLSHPDISVAQTVAY